MDTKIPKPSQLRPPKVFATNFKELSPITENQTSIIKKPATVVARNQFLRRRSKSVTDLRSTISKPLSELRSKATLTNSKLTSCTIQAEKKTTTRTQVGVKRKETQDDLAVKPKIAKLNEKPKKEKIPAWDFKSRFNFLNEKHNLLKSSFNDLKTKSEVLVDIEEKYTSLEKKYIDLEKETVSLRRENKSLLPVKNENSYLKHVLASLTAEHEKLNKVYHDLLNKEKTNLNTIRNLNVQLGKLTQEHDEVCSSYEELKNLYSLLRLENDATNKENECLHSEITEAKNYIKKMEVRIQQYQLDIASKDLLRRKLHNQVQDLKGNIRVFCRVRPLVTDKERERLQCNITYLDECNLEIRKSRESVSAISGKLTDTKLDFTFDHVFSPQSTQDDVFQELSQLIQSALDGYNVCVFAYGQTGSGKTFTMQGEYPDQLGMIPKSIDKIFEEIQELESRGWKYSVNASFVEIYNETLVDLLDPKKHTCEIRFNEGNIVVTNLKIEPIFNAAEMNSLMNFALQNRKVASTNFNEHSSRSHAVTKIYLNGVNEERALQYSGSVSLVDLAGSESAKTSSSERLTETKNINKSLSTLGNVMSALHNKDPHIPFRNSKLTYLLQPCLGGNSKTLMIVNVSPFEDCYNDTVNSLRFAAKVKDVKLAAKRTKNLIDK